MHFALHVILGSHVAPDSTTSPPLTLRDVANNGVPVDAFPLRECQGDCNGDGDCEVSATHISTLINHGYDVHVDVNLLLYLVLSRGN